VSLTTNYSLSPSPPERSQNERREEENEMDPDVATGEQEEPPKLAWQAGAGLPECPRLL